jgi:methyl-accepting chemotaxis protein
MTRGVPAVTGRRWGLSLRSLLLSIVGALALLLAVAGGMDLVAALRERAEVTHATAVAAKADRLLAAAADWARERGQSNGALGAAAPAPAEAMAALRDRRRTADAALAEALAGIAPTAAPGSSLARAIETVAATHRQLEAARAAVDLGLALPRESRDPALAATITARSSQLIVEALRLRLAAMPRSDEQSVQLAELQNVRHFASVMAEYAGRERAIFAGLIAAGGRLQAETLATLAGHRGQVELSRDVVATYVAGSHATPAVRAAFATAEEVFFGRFEATRQAVRRAGTTGEAYPMTSAEWFTRSTEGIDTLLALGNALGEAGLELMATKKDDARNALVFHAALLAATLLAAIVAVLVVMRRVSGPLGRLTQAMTQLAAGNLAVQLPSARNDEIGAMTAALAQFKDSLAEAERLRAAARDAAEAAEAERRRATQETAEQIDATLGGIAAGLATTAAQLRSTADTIAVTAERSAAEAASAATGARDAGVNVQTAASAVEQMAGSVQEITRQVTQSARVAERALRQVRHADETMRGLTEVADRVGGVVRMISDIAGQTNLLALNATIEAARAGEAGKGFAVVASEVKTLASQTAKATDDIGTQIRAMQEATEAVVGSIRDIGAVVEEMHGIGTAISSAVEQQGAATQEIARNVRAAAAGTEGVTARVGSVSESASQASTSLEQLRDAIGEVVRQGDRLRADLATFLQRMRAAA